MTIEARAFGGYYFAGWNDGVTEERREVTVTSDSTFTAMFKTNVGVGEVEEETARIIVRNGRVIVEGVDCKHVQIYDLSGRRHDVEGQLPAGVYLVCIDGRIMKKVVVM